MRIAPLLVAVSLPVFALAADKTKPAVIEKLIAQNVTGLAKDAADDKLGLAKDPVIAVHGDLEKIPDMGITTIAGAYYAGNGGKKTHKVGKTTLAIDDAKGIAYFQTPFDVAIRWEDSSGGGGGQSFKGSERIGGIAVRDGATWQLAAVMYSRHLDSDAKVIAAAKDARPVELPTGEPTIKGDAKLGAVVRGLFKTGFAPAAVKKGKRIASGTGPREFQVDAAAVKLAAAWDKIGMVPTSIEVTQIAGGAAAFAKVQCIWPAQKGKTLVPLLLGMVMVPDGADWRWVSMQFAPD